MKNLKKFVFIFMIILGFLLVIYGIYNLTLSNKSRMLNALDKYITKYIKEEKSDFRSFKIDSENSIVSLDKNNTNLNEKLNGEIYFDQKNDESYLKFLYSLSNVNLNMEFFSTKNEAYFKVKEIKDIFYKIKLDQNDKKLSSEYIKDSFIKSLRNNLDESDFEKEDANIKINGSSLKTKKYSVNVTSKNAKDILSDLKKEFKTDDEIISNILALFENDNDKTKLFTYSVYVVGTKNIVKHEFTIPVQIDNSNNNEVDFIISLDDYEKNKLDYKKLNMSIMTIDMLNFEIKETEKDSYTINGILDYDNQSIKISGFIDKYNVDLSIFVDNKKFASVKMEEEVVEKDKNYILNIIIEIESTIKFTSKNNITYDIEMPKIDISNSIDYETIDKNEKSIFQNFINSFIK